MATGELSTIAGIQDLQPLAVIVEAPAIEAALTGLVVFFEKMHKVGIANGFELCRSQFLQRRLYQPRLSPPVVLE